MLALKLNGSPGSMCAGLNVVFMLAKSVPLFGFVVWLVAVPLPWAGSAASTGVALRQAAIATDSSATVLRIAWESAR
jgi:hypothetical protein